MAQDPYQELGVSRTASADEIRRAFRKLAKQFHPDQNPDDKAAEERFKRVSAAFDVVGDEEKRKKFDRGEIDADGRESMRGFRPGGAGPRGGPGPGAGFGGFSGAGADFEGVDLNDILGEMFGARAGSRGGGFGGFSSKGQDVRAQVEISIEDAVKGARRRIAFSDGRTIEVTIPKGAADGQVLRLKGQGAPGPRPSPITRPEAQASGLWPRSAIPGGRFRRHGAVCPRGTFPAGAGVPAPAKDYRESGLSWPGVIARSKCTGISLATPNSADKFLNHRIRV